MSAQEELDKQKASVRRVVEEIYNQGKLEVIDQLFSPKCTFHDPVGDVVKPRSSHDLEGFKDDVVAIRTALPDVHYEIDGLVAENNEVVTRWTAQGTHSGTALAVAATNKKVTITGMTACKFDQGRIVDHFTQSDTLAVMAKVGIPVAAA